MQRLNDRRRTKIRIVKTLAAMLATILLAAAAFCMPGIVYSVNDRNTFAGQEAIHMELIRYEKEGSLIGQLFSFALCNVGYEMRSIHMEESTETISDEELTQVIQAELDRMEENGLLEEAPVIQAQELTGRELYTSYIDGLSGQRDSITFWKLNYQGTEEGAYSLEVVLDLEYHRIYSMKLSNEDVIRQCESYDAKKWNTSKMLTLREEIQWGFIYEICGYYKINLPEEEYGGFPIRLDGRIDGSAGNSSATVSVYDDERALKNEDPERYYLEGRIIFTNSDESFCSLLFRKEYTMTDGGQAYLYIGIDGLEQMLQI